MSTFNILSARELTLFIDAKVLTVCQKQIDGASQKYTNSVLIAFDNTKANAE